MTIRVGIIGLGVGSAHLHEYSADSRCEVIALCDLDEELLAKTGAQAGTGLKLFQDAQELLADPEIDAVSIASYDNCHHNQVLAAIASGKHIFVEKPLCILEQELSEIVAAFKDNKQLVLGSNLVLRTSPRFSWLRTYIEENKLGELLYLEGDYNYGRLAKITDGWRGKIENYSPTLGGGIHLIDLFLWLTQQRVVEVFSYSSKIMTANSSYRYPDTVAALLKFESGLTAKLGVNLTCVYPHFHRFQAYGSLATFENGHPEARLYSARDSLQFEPINLPYPQAPKGIYIKEFIDAIVQGRSFSISPDEIFNGVAVGLAIDKSARLGLPVRPEYF